MTLRYLTAAVPRQKHRNIAPSTVRRSGLAALLALTIAACGGSGSSGFDGAIESEADAIRVATSEGICLEFKGISYCGSGAPLAIGEDTAVVEFDESSEPVPCTQLPDDTSCSTSLGFARDGFPETAGFLGAWAEDASGPWTLSSVDDAALASASEDNGDVVVVVPGSPDGQPLPIVIAVLVYLDGAPDDAPDAARKLREFDPDFAYVSGEVQVAPSTPGQAR